MRLSGKPPTNTHSAITPHLSQASTPTCITMVGGSRLMAMKRMMLGWLREPSRHTSFCISCSDQKSGHGAKSGEQHVVAE